MELEKIESEKLKKIKPIEIKPSTAFLFISIFSSLFLIGGFLYTKFLLGFFGINTSNFFEISDYLSSSIDIIFSIFVSTLVGMIAYFYGLSSRFSEIVSAEQFGTKIPNRKFLFLLIHVAAIFVIQFAYMAIIHEVIHPRDLLVPIVWFLAHIVIVFDFFNIDKYIKNKLSFNAVTMALISFATYAGVTLFDTVIKVKDGRYESPYILSFQKEYKEYLGHDLFLANSQYIFLLNKETKEIVVIPRVGVKAIHAKKQL